MDNTSEVEKLYTFIVEKAANNTFNVYFHNSVKAIDPVLILDKATIQQPIGNPSELIIKTETD